MYAIRWPSTKQFMYVHQKYEIRDRTTSDDEIYTFVLRDYQEKLTMKIYRIISRALSPWYIHNFNTLKLCEVHTHIRIICPTYYGSNVMI